MHGQTFRPMLMSDRRPNGGGLGSRARDHHEPELLRPKKLLKRSEREASLDVVSAFGWVARLGPLLKLSRGTSNVAGGSSRVPC